jgi:hypothetical protein
MVSVSDCEPSSIRSGISKASFWQFTDDLSLIETFQRHASCCSVFLLGFLENIMGFTFSPLNLPKGRQKMKFAP